MCTRYFRLIAIIFALSHTLPLRADMLAWQTDSARSGSVSGSQGFWNDYLWGVDPKTGSFWRYDGFSIVPAGKVPEGYELTGRGTHLTDYGVFANAIDIVSINSSEEFISSRALLWSPDGMMPFKEVWNSQIYNKSPYKPVGLLLHSVIDLGAGSMLIAGYNQSAGLHYSNDSGQTWKLLFRIGFTGRPTPIDHFHGGYYDEKYNKLYLFTGDSNKSATILVCDDLTGSNGLLNAPATWKTRWGLDDEERSTLDTNYILSVDGIAQSQNTRTTAMHPVGNYLYWGEDTARHTGSCIFRVHRDTGATEQISCGITGHARKWLTLPSDEVIFFSVSGANRDPIIKPGHDEYMRTYQLINKNGTMEVVEIARFLRKDHQLPRTNYETVMYGVVEAWDQVYLNSNDFFAETDGDLVGSFTKKCCADFDGDGKVLNNDALIFGDAFLSRLGDANWNPQADCDGDGDVDNSDALQFGTDFLRENCPVPVQETPINQLLNE